MCAFRFEVWPTEHRHINQYFGANPQNYAQFGLPGHEGIDIMAPAGSRIFAVAPGQVSRVHTEATNHNYGIHVRVKHDEGYETIYAHLQEALVDEGARVAAGSVIGLADDTGNSFGDHLHLTLKKEGAQLGQYPPGFIDPTPFLLPLMGWQRPNGPYTSGWAFANGLFIAGELAQVNSGGINLRARPTVFSSRIGLVAGGTIVILTGARTGDYVPVLVANASIGLDEPPPPPAPPPPVTIATVDGWGWSRYLTITGDRAVVGQYGINLRMAPNPEASNIGVVKGGSSVSVLGPPRGEYHPLRVRRDDFLGPVNLPEPPPEPPTGGVIEPGPDSYLGWAWSPYLTPVGDNRAVVGRFGVNLRQAPDINAAKIGLAKGEATVTIVGQVRGEYTPVFVRKGDVINPASPMPAIEPPEPLPVEPPPPPPPPPVQRSTPGWVFSSQLTVSGSTGTAGPYGLNLRDGPRRDANNIGFVPGNATVIVTGAPQGEYTPIRVDNSVLQPPFGSQPPPGPPPPVPPPNPDPPLLGHAAIGLHASADPLIPEAEFREFELTRPVMIKVLSFHSGAAISRLATQHPEARWVVRAFLDFGGRQITPEKFLNDTISDVRRALDALAQRDVVVELHNEPNIVPEGLSGSWANGAEFSQWWLDLLARYRQALPGVRFIYPGLSPGFTVSGIKQDHIQFIEASRAAVEAADGLGVHLYWSNVYPMSESLRVLDDYIGRFRFKPIWVTEASNNKAGTAALIRAQQYLEFWQALQMRPTVEGVTYFVASATNPEFAEEVWVGRGIGRVVGRR